jgi:hypothetical protein
VGGSRSRVEFGDEVVDLVAFDIKASTLTRGENGAPAVRNLLSTL